MGWVTAAAHKGRGYMVTVIGAPDLVPDPTPDTGMDPGCRLKRIRTIRNVVLYCAVSNAVCKTIQDINPAKIR